MASDIEFVQFIVDQIDAACEVTFRAMFGEYALYSKGKVVALICEDQLFVKKTPAGVEFYEKTVGVYTEAPAYPGAKLSFLIEDHIEDRNWLSELIATTERALPKPRPKKKKAKAKRKPQA